MAHLLAVDQVKQPAATAKEATPQDKPPSAAAPAHRKLKTRAGTGRLRVVNLPPSVPTVRDKEPPPPTLVGLPMGVSPLPVQEPPKSESEDCEDATTYTSLAAHASGALPFHAL